MVPASRTARRSSVLSDAVPLGAAVLEPVGVADLHPGDLVPGEVLPRLVPVLLVEHLPPLLRLGEGVAEAGVHAVAEEVDLVAGQRLPRPALASIAGTGLAEAPLLQVPHVVLNMGLVAYIKSSNLAQLIRLRKLLHEVKRELLLCSVDDRVWSVMMVTGLDKLFNVAPDPMTALASIQLGDSDSDADATIKVNWDDFVKISEGAMDPTMAFMQGKLKVEGDMSVAMQLQNLMKKFS